MEIIKVAFFALTALFIYLLLKQNKSELGMLIVLVAGAGIFLYMIGQLGEVIDFINDIVVKKYFDPFDTRLLLSATSAGCRGFRSDMLCP